MRSFSWSQAFGAGFQLIGRAPAILLWWALAYLVLGILPQVGIMGLMWPAFAELIRSAGEGASPDISALMAMQGQMALVQLVSIVASVVSTSVLLGAAYRGVLEPEASRFGYLRLGPQELWIGLTAIVLYIAFIVAIFVLAIPGTILGVVLARTLGGWAAGLVALAACVLLGWLVLRFSLATVVAFAERRFDIGASWTLTAGQAWKMFLVALAIFVLLIVAELILTGVGIGVMFGAGLGAAGLMDEMADPMGMLARFWPYILVGSVVGAVLASAAFAILAAPFAEIYRELTAEPAA